MRKQFIPDFYNKKKLRKYECPKCGGWQVPGAGCRTPCPGYVSGLVSLTPAQKGVLMYYAGYHPMPSGHSERRLRSIRQALIGKHCLKLTSNGGYTATELGKFRAGRGRS